MNKDKTNLKTFQIGKWKIETDESEVQDKTIFYLRVYNTKATIYHQLKYNYYFRTEASRNEWVMTFVNNQKSWEQTKLERRKERKTKGRNNEITSIIKKALSKKYGYKNVRVTRGSGTAYGWVSAHVKINAPEPKCEMDTTSNWGRCYKCSEKYREYSQEVYRISKEAITKAGQKFGTWYGDDDYAKEEFNYDISFNK
jgi:thiamine pyrophosphate-dependent acetolactate synthase large subunit-like protein